ncbi:hypothetical protein [Methylobacterium sp. J-070]|uniref:hypothetical protein n=1 Tax=Methylobacterium sp. J-070 TaxID=2836650 RepID=UPI001FBB4347|nr:hypothetical protein [Methylobacterium sp. J-070]MCJ2054675.1 hypothetical protein [Methylobacterium sp. J-070]
MSFRASLKNLIRRDPSTGLRERAAATARRVREFGSAATGTTPAPPMDLAQVCDQAVIDWNAIQPASRAEHWGDEQLDEALNAYDAVFQRAIDEPSRDLAEVRAKARLLLHGLIEHTCHDPSDEATLTVDERLTRVVLRKVANLAGTTALTPPADPTDWHNPPPGFMAYPADDPQGFVIVREGLRLELERLHRIALAEYARKVGPDATEATRARVRRELRLGVFESASPNGDAEILALGLDLDAAHARWRAATPAYWAAQDHVSQACKRAKARGGSVTAACEAAWKGVSQTRL